MEIIIGREEGARRLHCIADGREFNVGQAGCVPTTVSRKHCRLTVTGESITIENLREQNITYVDGNQIFSKVISANSRVQLGSEHYNVPLQQVIQLATGKSSLAGSSAGKTQEQVFSLRPLKNVWDEYDRRKLDIQERAAKKANQQRIQGIVSMCGMALGLLPIDPEYRIICVIAALLLGIYFFIQGNNSDSVQRQLHDLDEEYARKYKCPNPACGKPFGSIPYRQIEYNRQCLACGCKYEH